MAVKRVSAKSVLLKQRGQSEQSEQSAPEITTDSTCADSILQSLKGRRVLLGVAGGIACYKAVEVLRLLKRSRAEVQVVLSREARRFVPALTFETLAGMPVANSRLGLSKGGQIEHIQLAQWAEVVLVAPTTANLLAVYRGGLASETLSATLLATKALVLLAPAMNNNMWDHVATQENVSILRERGVRIIAPAYGELAEGWQAVGRLPEPSLLVATLAGMLAGMPLKISSPWPSLVGKKILISAGPTIEDIDPVRFISNRSSGKMGYALARACQQLGATVTLISGPVALSPPPDIKTIQVRNTEQMRAAVLKAQPEQNALLLCAAVSDFKPIPVPHKIKHDKIKHDQIKHEQIKHDQIKHDQTKHDQTKHDQTKHDQIKYDQTALRLKLVPNPDIAQAVGQKKTSKQLLVIFATETSQHLLAEAKRKMKAKNADIVIANPIDQAYSGFDSDFNQATMITRLEPDKEKVFPVMPKTLLAHEIVQLLAKILKEQ